MQSMPSVMSHNFSRVPNVETPRSTFNRSHGAKLTLESAGQLVPILVDEVLPGDSFSVDMAGFARLATPLHPFMDNVRMSTHFFFVPNRLVWDNFQKFMGEQDNPDDSTDYLVPQITAPTGGFAIGSIYDHMGIPTGVEGLKVNALHLRAYNLIWNDWFRDQNLQDSVVTEKGDGPDTDTDYALLRRGKRHDYFTSALPWPQKGDSVKLPLGTQAPVEFDGQAGVGSGDKVGIYSTSGQRDTVLRSDTSDGFTYVSTTTSDNNLYANLELATAATVNELREAFQMQKMMEVAARSGSRYTEIVRGFFGVTSPDSRLQRPEYLGGGTTNIQVNPIAQTSSSDGTTPQGNLSAIGTGGFKKHGFNSSFTEHGVIIGLVSIDADLTYQQGLNKMWSRRTKWDFYWPQLAHLGEQPILNKEIYAQGDANDDAVFGYQERFAEYRYKPSTIHGKMRSSDPASLDAWHLSQDFNNLPVLDATFIESNPPIDRVIAVTDEPQFIMDTYVRMKCTRPMPTYSVPGLIDHF